MGTTATDWAIQKIVGEKMQDPAWASVLIDTLGRMNNGFWDRSYLNVFLQKHRFKYDLFDAYTVANLHAMINSGKIARVVIDIAEHPISDSLVDEMNGILQNHMSPPFTAEFWGGNYDGDGKVEWSEEIVAQVSKVYDDRTDHFYVRVPPRSATLEVGSTTGAKTLSQVRGERAVARWPYESGEITILLLVEPSWQLIPVDEFAPTLFDHAAGLQRYE